MPIGLSCEYATWRGRQPDDRVDLRDDGAHHGRTSGRFLKGRSRAEAREFREAFSAPVSGVGVGTGSRCLMKLAGISPLFTEAACQGCLPARNGQSGQPMASHSRTSLGW